MAGSGVSSQNFQCRSGGDANLPTDDGIYAKKERQRHHSQYGRNPVELQVRIYQISFSRGFEKTMLQIEKPDDLQLTANLIRFFRMHYNFLSMMEISQKV